MPAPTLQLIAMHGWAGAASHWTPWQVASATLPYTWQCGERGYSGEPPVAPTWGPHGRRVVLAHSLGPHLLDPEVLVQAEAVILLASFGRFLPPGRAGRPWRVALTGMAAALADGPDEATAAARSQAMLAAFLAKVAAPDPQELLPPGLAEAPVAALARQRLRDDLARLAACDGLPAGWPSAAPVLLVEAGADGIVTPEAQALLRQSLPAAAVRRFPQAGHAFLQAPLIPLVLEWLERSLRA
jgi:pimeloyl-[acyl-carrier protein] methyl ester esterase